MLGDWSDYIIPGRGLTLYRFCKRIVIGAPMMSDQGLEICIKWFEIDALRGSAIAVLCIFTGRGDYGFVCL